VDDRRIDRRIVETVTAYQRVPDIPDAIKVEVDADSRPGRFLLAGSTRFDALPRVGSTSWRSSRSPKVSSPASART
jgi:hypothetical protein